MHAKPDLIFGVSFVASSSRIFVRPAPGQAVEGRQTRLVIIGRASPHEDAHLGCWRWSPHHASPSARAASCTCSRSVITPNAWSNAEPDRVLNTQCSCSARYNANVLKLLCWSCAAGDATAGMLSDMAAGDTSEGVPARLRSTHGILCEEETCQAHLLAQISQCPSVSSSMCQHSRHCWS